MAATRADRSTEPPPDALWAQLQADISRRIKRGEFDGVDFPASTTSSPSTTSAATRCARRCRRCEPADCSKAVAVDHPRRLPGDQPGAGDPVLAVLLRRADRARPEQCRAGVLDARADGVVAARLGLEESTLLVYLERLRLSDGEPRRSTGSGSRPSWLPAARGRLHPHLVYAQLTDAAASG